MRGSSLPTGRHAPRCNRGQSVTSGGGSARLAGVSCDDLPSGETQQGRIVRCWIYGKRQARSALEHFALLQDEDVVGESDGRQAMRHDDAGTASEEPAEGAVDQALGGRVELR